MTNIEVSGYRDSGIAIGSYNGRSGFRDVRVERSRATTTGTAASSRTRPIPTCTRTCTSVDPASNNKGQPESSKNSGSGIALGGVDGATIEHNLAYKNGGLNTTIQGGVGIGPTTRTT